MLASGRPTSWKVGKPRLTSISTCTRQASTPITDALSIVASMPIAVQVDGLERPRQIRPDRPGGSAVRRVISQNLRDRSADQIADPAKANRGGTGRAICLR